jgi:ATP synthase F1 delta subunit
MARPLTRKRPASNPQARKKTMNHDADPQGSQPTDFHADVGAERLARVYAESLFAAAENAAQTTTVIEELDSLIDDVFKNDTRLEGLFAGAAVGRTARRASLEKVFASRASSLFYKFLMVLNEHERLDLLRAIRQALHELDNERHHRMKVHVYTAVALPAGFGERIAGVVRQRFGLEPILVPHVDPSLLGGMKIRVGDQQLDASVRTRLDNLRNQIIARSSYEIQSRRDHFRTG